MKPKLTLPTEYTYTLIQKGPITHDIAEHSRLMHLTVLRCSDAFNELGQPNSGKLGDIVRIMRKTLSIAATGKPEAEVMLDRVNPSDQFLGQTQRAEIPSEHTFKQLSLYLSDIELADKTRLTYMVLAQLNHVLNKDPTIAVEDLLKMFNALCFPKMYPRTENLYPRGPREIFVSGHHEYSKKQLNKELNKRFRAWQIQFPSAKVAAYLEAEDEADIDDLDDMFFFMKSNPSTFGQ